MANRNLLRLSATLLFVGELFSLLVGLLHPSSGTPNNYTVEFTVYANSADWAAVHLGQFVGIAVIIAGLLVLFFALNVLHGTPGWMGRFAAVSAVVALALYGVLQAVDGVALKQAVDAWVSAPVAEQAARFASAEAIRWLEWGTRSYQSFMFGLSLVLFATVIVWTARVPRPIGYLMGLSGLTYLVNGWLLGTEGFSATDTVTQLLGYVLIFAWSIWLLIVAWRMKESVEAATA